MNNDKTSHGWKLAAPLAFVLLLATAGLADDSDFFQATIPPNVVFIIDNSWSMNNIVWHPAYNPDAVYDPINCPYVADPDDPNYDPDCLQHPLCAISTNDADFDTADSGWFDNGNQLTVAHDVSVTECSNTRTIFVDPLIEAEGEDTWWTVSYLKWYFSENVEEDPDGDGITILQDILSTTNGVRSQCLIDAGKSATYSKYNRSRLTAGKEILREVICSTNSIATIRYGLAKFASSFSDPVGGYLVVPVADYDSTQAAALENAIDAIAGETYTPLAETLYYVYRYFMSRTSSETPVGKDGSTHFPVYNRDTSGGTSGTIPGSPVTEDCQKNFVILITDGAPTGDDFDSMDPTVFKDDLIGDYPSPGGDEDEEPPNNAFSPDLVNASCGGNSWDNTEDSCESSRYLNDIAQFMQDVDFRPGSTYPSKQTIDVYTVGFTTSDATNALLQSTADNGNGKAFFSNNAEELTEALSKALSEVVTKSRAFTAATVPSSRATDGNNFFTSYFEPSDNPFWRGHLKLFEFSAKGEIRDKPTAAQLAANQLGDCAMDDPLAPNRCSVGRVKIELDGYWDAANEIPVPANRKLYVSDYASAAPTAIPSTPVAFNTTNVTATDLGLVAGDESAYSIVTPVNTAPTDATTLAASLIAYARGCQFGTASCIDRGDGEKLWDIFHSNPVVVGPPNRGVRDDSYRAFVAQYKHRKRVIYAGSNGLFVHGFNTGEYQATNTADFLAAPGFDRGTGVEELGFMAYPARDKLVDLPLEHTLNMDGSPQAGDVWLYENGTSVPGSHSTLQDWEEWRTVLIGGMREGGRVVWALDVTDPPDSNNANGQSTNIAYPGYMWEFPCEADEDLCNGTDLPGTFQYKDYMGETWSDPVITRIKVHVSCFDPDPADCDTYDRWVAIFGAGYDRQGDPNLTHDSTGVDVNAYDSSNSSTTSRAGRAIFMVDITTGEVMAMKRFADSSSDGETGMKYAITASPAVFDIDRDGYADVVYIGDLGGNLWKWVITDPVDDPINDTGDIDQPDWPFVKLFTADSCTSGTPHYRSFYYAPTGALVGSSLWLAWGSGERQELDFVGTRDCEKNRFYVLKDDDPLELEPPVSGRPYGDAADLEDADNLSGACNVALPADKKGYYVEAIHGEKFITESQIFFGVVLSGSFVPSSSADACASAGDAYLYGFNLFCGQGLFPDPSDPDNAPPVRMVHIGSGLPNEPRVSVGPPKTGGTTGGGGGGGGDDCEDIVLVITSDGDGFKDCPGGRPDSGVKIKSWRDE